MSVTQNWLLLIIHYYKAGWLRGMACGIGIYGVWCAVWHSKCSCKLRWYSYHIINFHMYDLLITNNKYMCTCNVYTFIVSSQQQQQQGILNGLRLLHMRGIPSSAYFSMIISQCMIITIIILWESTLFEHGEYIIYIANRQIANLAKGTDKYKIYKKYALFWIRNACSYTNTRVYDDDDDDGAAGYYYCYLTRTIDGPTNNGAHIFIYIQLKDHRGATEQH